jgi:hypothetical protein
MKNHQPEKDLFDAQIHASGPEGRLPLQSDFLTHAPNGHVFGLKDLCHALGEKRIAAPITRWR